MKTKIALMVLLLGSTFAFGKEFLTDGEVISSDVSDSWVKIGVNPQTATPSNPVNVYVDKGVSITASSYLMIYENNSITFRGGNTVNGGTVSVKENSALYAEDTIFNVDQITFMGNGSNTVLKNCTLNITNQFTIRAENSGNLVLDNTKITTSKWSGYAGTTHPEDGLFNITLKNGSSLNITDAPSYGSNGGANIRLESGSSLTANSSIVSGSDIFVGSGCSFDVDGSLTTDKTITVASDATIDASSIAFDKLQISFSKDLSAGGEENLNLADIFGENAGVVAAAIESGKEFTVIDANGNEYEAELDDAGGSVIHIGVQIPEPSAYAAVFGVLALACVMFRRRK